MMQEVVTDSPKQTHTTAEEFLDTLRTNTEHAVVVGFVGPLGAGKTEFIRGLLRSVGIDGPITSPTYTIETVYELLEGEFARAYHIDAYRLAGGDDLKEIGFVDRMQDAEGIILLEWAKRVENILPEHTIWIDISPEDNKRVITIQNGQGK